MKLDEHPKPKTTLEQLAKLPPVFKKGGVVTAGGASGVEIHLQPLEVLLLSSFGLPGICDGAAAVMVASEEAVKEHNLTPLARCEGLMGNVYFGEMMLCADKRVMNMAGHFSFFQDCRLRCCML